MKSSVFQGTKLVFRKEFLTGRRFQASWLTMLMFALTTLACVSLALRGAALEPGLRAALLWIILFFSAMTGVDRLFADEALSGTLLALKIYGSPQPVLFGKMLYAIVLLLMMALFVSALFFVFVDAPPSLEGILHLIPVLLLGMTGLAAAGTLVAALSAGARVKSGLFPVLMLPVMLPVMLPAIAVTEGIFQGGTLPLSHLGIMAVYDALLTLGSSMLFDYFWFEE